MDIKHTRTSTPITLPPPWSANQFLVFLLLVAAVNRRLSAVTSLSEEEGTATIWDLERAGGSRTRKNESAVLLRRPSRVHPRCICGNPLFSSLRITEPQKIPTRMTLQRLGRTAAASLLSRSEADISQSPRTPALQPTSDRSIDGYSQGDAAVLCKDTTNVALFHKAF